MLKGFSNLEVVVCGGPVGLWSENKKVRLNVPYGMEHIKPIEAFALLYKALAVFKTSARSQERVGQTDGLEHGDGAGASYSDDGFSFADAQAFDRLFSEINPLRLLSLIERRGMTRRIDYSRIDLVLHRAFFLNDGTPVVDSSIGVRREIRFSTSEIVGLYCFVAEDFYVNCLKIDLEKMWGAFASEASYMATNFRHRYLGSESSLFAGSDDEVFGNLETLRHVLHTINRNTPYKSHDYHSVFDALDAYLNGGVCNNESDGLIWGVKDFWAVWESICLVNAASEFGIENILTGDHEHLPRGLVTDHQKSEWVTKRKEIFLKNEIERRPDLVAKKGDKYFVVDFKYYEMLSEQRVKKPSATERVDAKMPEQDLKKVNDFDNLEVYGLLLQNHLLVNQIKVDVIVLQFWIPGGERDKGEPVQNNGWSPILSVIKKPVKELMSAYCESFTMMASRTLIPTAVLEHK